jgi:hypothetical protein
MNLIKSAALIYVAFASNLQAQTVVQNSNLQLEVGPFGIFDGNVVFNVWQDLNKTDFTRAGFFYDGENLTPDEINLDEGTDWYLVKPGDTFSKSTIAAGKFPFFQFFGNPPHDSIPVGYQDFYLGVATQACLLCHLPNIPPNPGRTVFGWVHVRPIPAPAPFYVGLEMVENVMSYDSLGIIVGTTRAIPEPRTIALAGCGLGIALGMVRRKSFPTN